MSTQKQQKVLSYIQQYQEKKGYAPSLKDICKRFRLSSQSNAHYYEKKLEEAGLLKKESGRHRGVSVVESHQQMVQIPLLGVIAAGAPIEAIENKETIAVSQSRLPLSMPRASIYALKVHGDSMVEENINDGDIVLVKGQDTAENGERVVALLDNSEATLKTFYKERGKIRLQPANKNYEPIIVEKGRDFAVQGIVLDVVRTIAPRPSFFPQIKKEERRMETNLPLNKIICGDAVEEMKKIPSESVDMTFADPPFNLNKKYGAYKDRQTTDDYIKWCEDWLSEMVRITKPTGSILVHNIPKWLIYCANHLNKIAFFKHWIAWDSMSTPLGKTLLPAHYGILFYTKQPKGFTFHELRALHRKCRKCGEMIKDYGGKKSQINPHGTLLSDVWADIHRIRHNTRRDEHPCQLPEPLLERLVLMTTNEGDVVLDPFIGAGTTALAAKRLGRNYIGIDVDPKYEKIITDKIKKVNYRSSNGYQYKDNNKKVSDYLKNLTVSEDEGVYPIDNPKLVLSQQP